MTDLVERAEQLKPHAECVLVLLHEHNPAKQAVEREQVSPGGIIMPDVYSVRVNDHVSQTKRREKPQHIGVYGTIIAVGPGHYDQCVRDDCTSHSNKWIPNELTGCEGMVCVLEHAFVGDVVPIAGVEHRMVRERDVLMVLEEDETAE